MFAQLRPRGGGLAGVGVLELLVAIPGPDFSFIDFCQTSVCPHIQCGRGGEGEGTVGAA